MREKKQCSTLKFVSANFWVKLFVTGGRKGTLTLALKLHLHFGRPLRPDDLSSRYKWKLFSHVSTGCDKRKRFGRSSILRQTRLIDIYRDDFLHALQVIYLNGMLVFFLRSLLKFPEIINIPIGVLWQTHVFNFYRLSSLMRSVNGAMTKCFMHCQGKKHCLQARAPSVLLDLISCCT